MFLNILESACRVRSLYRIFLSILRSDEDNFSTTDRGDSANEAETRCRGFSEPLAAQVM